MKRTIEIVMIIVLIGIGTAFLLMTWGSKDQVGNPGYHVAQETQSAAFRENSTELDPADTVKLAPFSAYPHVCCRENARAGRCGRGRHRLRPWLWRWPHCDSSSRKVRCPRRGSGYLPAMGKKIPIPRPESRCRIPQRRIRERAHGFCLQTIMLCFIV